MKKIYVVTVTTGNRGYSIFRDSLRTLSEAIGYFKTNQFLCDQWEIKHIIYLNTDTVKDKKVFLEITQEASNAIILFDENRGNIGIANALNECNNYIKKNGGCELILKMDDDVFIHSLESFFTCATIVHERFKNMVFSPYPVGLINNPGGPPALSRFVYLPALSSPITFRRVNHVGGMCRFVPFEIFENFKFESDLIPGISGTEDGQLSKYCNDNNIEMCYLENTMVVEHAYSTLGQIVVDKEYFSGRSFEESVKIEVVKDNVRSKESWDEY